MGDSPRPRRSPSSGCAPNATRLARAGGRAGATSASERIRGDTEPALHTTGHTIGLCRRRRCRLQVVASSARKIATRATETATATALATAIPTTTKLTPPQANRKTKPSAGQVARRRYKMSAPDGMLSRCGASARPITAFGGRLTLAGLSRLALALVALAAVSRLARSLQQPADSQAPAATLTASAFGCPYPAVGSNCQVNIVAQSPAVPLISTDFVSDEFATLKPDTQASYKCDQGYELLGQETLTCLPSGRWSAQPPSCVTNIAVGKPTNQSSTVKGGDSRNANDGKSITQHDSKHCTETRVDQSPWWQIDLLQTYEIRSVRLLGRACCNSQQMSLHDIEIRVGNSSTLQGNRLCAWYPNNLDEGVARDFQCAHPIVGRFVSIQMVGIEAALSLCEVMVFSTKEFPPDRCGVQSTVAPTNSRSQATPVSPGALTSSTGSNSSANIDISSQIVVFNRTCYEMQTSNGGSFLVADTYCRARGGSLLHSVNNLTQAFVSQELEKMKSKLKSKLVWLGAKREVSSANSQGPLTAGSTFALINNDPPMAPFSSVRSLMASLDESVSSSLFSGDHSHIMMGEQSPVFGPSSSSRTSLLQVSSGAGGSTSRGSQTFGLPSVNSQPSNRSVEHSQRSLVVSQPVASYFTPPVPLTSNQAQGLANHVATTSSSSPSSPNNFAAALAHRSLRPPSLVPTPTSTVSSQLLPQSSWLQETATSSSLSSANLQSSNSAWRWVGDSQSETLHSPVTSFMWADDQPNNYNNQQDCMVLDGAKRWLWNDVTCELDYLPWVCQYRPSKCGSPDRHENSTIHELPSSPEIDTPYRFGKVITYACPMGHRMDGSRQRKCQYDGTWSGRAPRCQYVNCGPLNVQSIENGRIIYLNQSQTTFGSQVKYVCNDDYTLVGNDLRQCQNDGRWSGKQPVCAYKWCPKLNDIPNASLNVSGLEEGSVATYQCNPGYKLIGNDTRQCLLGGKWTNQPPFCQYVECDQPKSITNGNYQLVNGTTNYLSVVIYECNTNYTLVGSANRMVCSHNNRWTGKEPQCSLIDCGQPQANPGSTFIGSSYSVHSTIEYRCDPGFKETSGSSHRTCGLDGQWTGQPLSCKYVECGRVPAILKGEISYINGTTYLASQVEYECTPGNRLSGHKIRFCGPDGRWTGSSPKCEEVRCSAPELPSNGSAIYIGNDRSFKEQSFSVGVTVQYECDYGHVVKGNWASRLCQANGEWSGEPPVCKFVDCGLPPSIESGNYVLKHPPTTGGPPGSLTNEGGSNTRRNDAALSNQAASAGMFTYYGTIAHYSCEANFKLQGPSQRECLESGQWRTPLPTCEPIQCPKPEFFDEYTQVSLIPRHLIDQTRVSTAPLANSFAQESQMTSGLQAVLARAIRLISNNQWINHDSTVQSSTFNVGDKLHYSCTPGYESYGGPEIRTCTQYGQWSGSSTPRCRLIDCGRPAPIGQEGRYYLLNQTTTFNSLVEYACVRPFKLVEMKVRQSGNLIETLTAAQAGVIPILTSLPIGVKVCANNGQWMPNDQQPRCVSPNSDGSSSGITGHGGSRQQFDGGDNTLDSSGRPSQGGQIHTNGGVSNNHDNAFGLDSNLMLDATIGNHFHAQNPSASLWAKIIIACCLLVMLALVILTLICIRSGKRTKQSPHRASILTAASNGHPVAMAAAMQLQLAANGVAKTLSAHTQQQQQVPLSQQPIAGQNIYINGAQKMFPQINGSSAQNGNHHHMTNQLHHMAQSYGDASSLMMAQGNLGSKSMVKVGSGAGSGELLMNGKAGSMPIVGSRVMAPGEHPTGILDSYGRLAVESDGGPTGLNSKTIRHNPNGLVTFVSPAQVQQQQQQQQGRMTSVNGSNQHPGVSSQHHQVSPQSISTSLSISSSSSPSSSSSAHHTTATRLSATDTSSASSTGSNKPSQRNGDASSNNPAEVYQMPQQFALTTPPSPPSLPAHPPPPHRLQHHHKQLMSKKNQQQPPSQQQQLHTSTPAGRLQALQPAGKQQQAPTAGSPSSPLDSQDSNGNLHLQKKQHHHHYMEPEL